MTHADDRQAVVQAAGGRSSVEFYETAAHVVDAITRLPAAGVIWELGRESSCELRASVRAVRELAADLPQVFRVQLSPQSAQQLCELVPVAPATGIVSLRRWDDLATDLGRLVTGHHESGPDFPILQGLNASQLHRRRDLVAVAAVLGKLPMTVRLYAATCHRSVSGLEKYFAAERILPPKRLLEWSLCLHALWRVSVLGWSVRRTALETGFTDPNALSNRIARNFDTSLTALATATTFTELLDQFLAVVRADGPRRASPDPILAPHVAVSDRRPIFVRPLRDFTMA